MKRILCLLLLAACLTVNAQTKNGALPAITSINSLATFPVTTDNGLNDWKIAFGDLVGSFGVGFGASNALSGNLTSGVVPVAGTGSTNLVDGPIVISAVTNATLPGVFRANTFATDPGTGMFKSATNVIGFSTGGTEQWAINSSGALVAVGTVDIGNGLANPRDVNVSRGFVVGAQGGIAATIDVLVGGSTTNRLVYVGGILVSNITGFH